MSMVIRSTFRIVLVFLLISFASAQTPWVPVGPDGGDVRTLTSDPHNPGRVLLTTSAGMVFESRDGGVNWSRLARIGDRNDYVIDSVIFHPTRENLVYAGVWSVENNHSGDVLKSFDGGRTWRASRDIHGQSIRALAMAPSNPNVLVAGTLTGVYRTTDAGEHWNLISPPNHADIRNVESIAIDPTNPDIIYAGTWHLPWKTADGGLTWKNIKNGIIDDSDVFSIIIDPHAPSVVYASACSGIYKSENGGDSFKKVQGIPYSSRRTRVLMQDPVRSEVVYAGTTEGLWRTIDAGQSWSRLTGANIIVNDVLVDSSDPKKIMLATDRSGVMMSGDWGGQFSASNRGFAHRQVSAMLADYREPDTVYAGVVNDKEFGGVFVSRDGGSAWQQMSMGLDGADVYALQQDADGDLLAGTNRGLFMYRPASKDYRWVPLQVNTAPQLVGKGKTRKRVKPSTMVFRVNDMNVTGNLWIAAAVTGLFSSADHGKTWIAAETSGLADFVSIRSLGDERIAVARRGVVVSHDGGRTWKRPILPNSVTTITDGTLDNAGNMYFSAREGVYRSNDGGHTWARLNRVPVINLSTIVWDGAARRLLISSSASQDIYESRDAGEHWRTLNVGWTVRSMRLAHNRTFAATQFDGILMQPQDDFNQSASRGAIAGGSQD